MWICEVYIYLFQVCNSCLTVACLNILHCFIFDLNMFLYFLWSQFHHSCLLRIYNCTIKKAVWTWFEWFRNIPRRRQILLYLLFKLPITIQVNKKRNIIFLTLKGLETFNTCFFQSVNNGLSNVSTSFLWSDPAGVGVIWRKLFCVFGCRPLKMCLQLLLWLEKDSSFDVVQNTMQGYCLPVGTT